MPSRRRPRPRIAVAAPEPITRLSLAPFAGLFLIAATLVAATYRLPNHVILVNLPALPYPGWVEPLSPPYNLLAVDSLGRARWNSALVSDAELARILEASKAETPQPALLFAPDGEAGYGRSAEVLLIVERLGLVDHCFQFAELYAYARFDGAPGDIPPPLPQSYSCAVPYGY